MTAVTRKIGSVSFGNVVGIALIMSSGHAVALEQSGQVNQLEVWSNGNVAFTLDTATTECNGQFILNKSVPGSKNHYAAVLTAKTSGRDVNVNYSNQCGAAENYGGSYNIPTYIYVK